MSTLLAVIRPLVSAGDYIVSRHGGRRLLARGITLDEVVAGIESGTVVEEYPQYFAGPAALVLSFDTQRLPVHAVWGIKSGASRPATLITAYRPDPEQWLPDFRTRKP